MTTRERNPNGSKSWEISERIILFDTRNNSFRWRELWSKIWICLRKAAKLMWKFSLPTLHMRAYPMRHCPEQSFLRDTPSCFAILRAEIRQLNRHPWPVQLLAGVCSPENIIYVPSFKGAIASGDICALYPPLVEGAPEPRKKEPDVTVVSWNSASCPFASIQRIFWRGSILYSNLPKNLINIRHKYKFVLSWPEQHVRDIPLPFCTRMQNVVKRLPRLSLTY